MQLEIIENTGKKLKFNIKEENHTLCALLRDAIWKEKDVDFVGYTINPSIYDEAVFIIESNNEKPEELLKKALADIKKQLNSLEASFKNLK